MLKLLKRKASKEERVVSYQVKTLTTNRFKHIGQYLRWSMDLGLRFSPLSENEKSKMWVCADASFAPT
eukprot:4404438-Amphidinium_carterae.1